MEKINSKAEKTAMEKERNTQRPRSHAAHGTACRGFLAVQNQNFKLAFFNPANFPELNGPASLAGAGKKPLRRAVRL